MERYYNSSELAKILKEKIEQLGINPKIQANPALDSILDKILPDLEQVDRQIRVNEQDGRILLSWVQNNNGISYKNSFNVQKDYKNDLVISSFKEGTPPQLGEAFRFGKIADQYSFSTSDNQLQIAHSSSSINPGKEGYCDSFYHAELINYDEYGIISERQTQSGNTELLGIFDVCDYESMLVSPNRVIASNFNAPLVDYSKKTYQKRENIDTAMTIIEDKRNGLKYEASLPIMHGQGYSLKDMIVGYGGNLPDSVSILPKSKEEIDKMIHEEKDPKVQEGLQKWSKGRENYSYYSNECWRNLSTGYSK